MNTLDAIKARHSTRGFSDRQISDADLEAILFAGGQAAVDGIVGTTVDPSVVAANPTMMTVISAAALVINIVVIGYICAQAKKLCYAILPQQNCEMLIQWARKGNRICSGFLTGTRSDSGSGSGTDSYF